MKSKAKATENFVTGWEIWLVNSMCLVASYLWHRLCDLLCHRRSHRASPPPAIQQLHWLPIKSRIDFKILLLTCKILHNLAPSYLSELIHIYTPSRTLRSSSANQLFAPSANLTTMGSRAFSRSAPCLWNSLPPDICTSDSVSTFKSRLKTHLFRVAYSVSH
ncbi:uncharacterized protein LOC117442044 isoform X1 [Scomber scombrus]|uniref:Uncharacterized protein LOC117442044 isoform X1 n=1 Tax=Scomber scombrus TaxID=13677 RepID=A0AAV1PWC2_SCOSC